MLIIIISVFIHQNSIYLAGGNYDFCVIQSINFDGVSNLNEAKAKTWSILGELSNYRDQPVYGAYQAGLEFYDSKLFIIRPYGNRDLEKSAIQIFDLRTKTTQI